MTTSTINAPLTTLDEIKRDLSQSPDAALALDEIARSGGAYAAATRSRVIVRDGRNRVAAISSAEGAPSDPHLHTDFHEWWVILGGEVRYQIGEYGPFVASFGDIVIAPCGFRHDVAPHRGEQCIRLVVGPETSNHDIKGIPPARLIPAPYDLPPPNRVHTPLSYMIERNGLNKAWTEEVVINGKDRANMIHSLPGEANRAHWHPNCDEWWVVLRGALEWKVGARTPFVAGPGDIVFVEAGYAHEITTVGDESSIRLAVTTPDRIHHYLDDPEAPRPPRE